MENHWNGKLWYAYGTSMTSLSMGEYVPVVEELSGLNVVNLGIPGGCLTPSGYGRGDVKRAVMRIDDGKEKADLITLEVLPNEGATVGNIYDTDDVSFCGCFKVCKYIFSHVIPSLYSLGAYLGELAAVIVGIEEIRVGLVHLVEIGAATARLISL